MNKILIALVLAVGLSGNALALDDKSPKQVLELYNMNEYGESIVHAYFNGMGQALLASAWGRDFCTEGNEGYVADDWWNIYLKEYYSHEEIYDNAFDTLGYSSHGTILLNALRRGFPCAEENQDKE